MSELFSVWQFFPDDTYERVREAVEAKEAVEAARHYSSSVGAQVGTTRRVIITDGGDRTLNFEQLDEQDGSPLILPGDPDFDPWMIACPELDDYDVALDLVP